MSFAAGAACLAFEANVFHFLLQSERREGRSAESVAGVARVQTLALQTRQQEIFASKAR